MDTPKIFESEYRFCEILWENEPVSSSALVRLCACAVNSLSGKSLLPIRLSGGCRSGACSSRRMLS